MKKIFLLIVGLVSALYSFSSNTISDWQAHFSFEKDVTDIERIGEIIYAVSDGKLFSYNTLTKEYSVPLKDQQNTPILKIAGSSSNNRLLIIRTSFEVDIFDGKNFYSIPTLRQANWGIDKTINNIHINDSFAYISANFGMMIIDLQKAEIKETCLFRFPVYSSSVLDKYIYISTSKGFYRIEKENNIQNFTNWENYPISNRYSEGTYPFSDEEIKDIATFDNKLYLLVPNKALYQLNDDVVQSVNNIYSPQNIEIRDDKMFVYNTTKLWVNTANTSSSIDISNLISITTDANEGKYWVSAPNWNLSLIELTETSYSTILGNLKPYGPLTNYPFSMSFTGGKIRVVGGGYYYNVFNHPAQLSEFDSEGWYNYAKPTSSAKDYVCVEANPADPTNLLVPNWGHGIYEFKNKSYVKLHGPRNSSLTDIFGGSSYTRVSGLKFEGENKFWVCNTMVPTVLNLFEKEGDTWKSYAFNHPEIYSPHTASPAAVVNDLLVDSKGNKWIVSMSFPYVFIFNENGTPQDINDDRKRLITEAYDQYGNKVVLDAIYRIKEDKKGNVWIVTNTGLHMIKNRTDVFTDDIIFNKIEGVNNTSDGAIASFLSRASVNDIAIDNINRKWIGTEENGVFLVDEDGYKVLAHFTTGNSPIPANRILSIAVDQDDHVFIGTEQGIITYSGNLAMAEKQSFSSVHAYPNPVSKDFIGEITIKGLKIGSLVKIINKDNKLINSGIARDGLFKWNINDIQGLKVAPDIYYILGTDENDKKGIVYELRIIN